MNAAPASLHIMEVYGLRFLWNHIPTDDDLNAARSIGMSYNAHKKYIVNALYESLRPICDARGIKDANEMIERLGRPNVRSKSNAGTMCFSDSTLDEHIVSFSFKGTDMGRIYSISCES